MSGIYLDFLLLPDYLFGDIVIEDEVRSQMPGSLLSVRIDPADSLGHLVYKQSDGSLCTIGFIVPAPSMKEFVITLHEQNRWEGGNGLVLTYPALARGDAVTTTHRILSEQTAHGFLNRTGKPEKDKIKRLDSHNSSYPVFLCL